MPVSGQPNLGNNVVWPTGVNETSMITASGETKRVTTENDISVRDINSLRIFCEAMSVHAHDYQDNTGGC